MKVPGLSFSLRMRERGNAFVKQFKKIQAVKQAFKRFLSNVSMKKVGNLMKFHYDLIDDKAYVKDQPEEVFIINFLFLKKNI